MATEEEWPWYLVAVLIVFIVLILITAGVLVWCCFRCWSEDGTWWTTRKVRRKRRYVNMTSNESVYGLTSSRKMDGLRLKTAVNDSINITLQPGEDGKIPPLRAETIEPRRHRKYQSSNWRSYLLPVQSKFKQIPRYFRGRRHKNRSVKHVHATYDDVRSFRSLPPARVQRMPTTYRSFRGEPASMRKAISWHGANSDYTLVRVKNSLGEMTEAKPDYYFEGLTGLDTHRPTIITQGGDGSSVIGPVLTGNGHVSRMDADNIFRSADPPNTGSVLVGGNSIVARGTYAQTIALDTGTQAMSSGQAVLEPTYSSVPVLRHERAHVFHGGDGSIEAPIVPQQVQLLYS